MCPKLRVKIIALTAYETCRTWTVCIEHPPQPRWTELSDEDKQKQIAKAESIISQYGIHKPDDTGLTSQIDALFHSTVNTLNTLY